MSGLGQYCTHNAERIFSHTRDKLIVCEAQGLKCFQGFAKSTLGQTASISGGLGLHGSKDKPKFGPKVGIKVGPRVGMN